MSGLLRRIRRPGAAEETRTQPAKPAPAHGSAPEAPATREDGQRLPAGVAPEDLERRGASGRRSRLRRRARFLRKARELALRDLGGLVYEARRREQDGGKLVEEKVSRLSSIDAELTGIEAALGQARGETLIREPGVGGTCPRCGELHGSEARFCAHCGANLAEAAREAAERARAEEAAKAAAEPKAASDGTGNGRPATKGGDAPAAERPTTTADGDPAAERPTTKAGDEGPAPGDPATEQPATKGDDQGPAPGAPALEQPAMKAGDDGPAPGAPTTEQPAAKAADESATKPLA